jgi:hypothetical protein
LSITPKNTKYDKFENPGNTVVMGIWPETKQVCKIAENTKCGSVESGFYSIYLQHCTV